MAVWITTEQATTTKQWRSHTFSGLSLNQSQVNGLQIWAKPKELLDSDDKFFIDVIYVDVGF